MSNSFEEEQIKEQEFGRLYRRLASKIHPDKFPKEKYGSFLKAQAQELFNELEGIRTGKRIKNGSTVILANWDEKLREIREFNDEIDDFVSRAEKDAQPEPDPDAQKKSFMTEKKFRETYPDLFTRPKFDSEFSAMYVSGYDENTGKVKIKITPSGGRLEEKELESVEDLENIIREVLTDKTKTFREVFGFDSSSKDNKSEEKNKWEEFRKKYEKHEDFINKKGDYFDEEGNWIHFAGFGEDGVDIWDSLFSGQRRKVSLDEFEDLLKKYKHYKSGTERKRKMEDVEKERARRAQEEINKQNFDEHPDQEDEKNKQQEEFNQATEEETGDGAKMDKENEAENDKKERQVDLEQIKQDLEKARKEFLEVDYKKNKAYKRLGKFFGRIWKDKENELRENDQDIAWYRAHYDNKLIDYRNALLEEAKARGASNQELGEIAKTFMLEANLNMAEAHDQVKVEQHEGKAPEFMKTQMLKMSDWYRKLPLAKKLAFGVALGFGTLAAGATGSALLIGTAASAATIRRAFLGMVTGTSVALTAEAATQKRRAAGVEKESVEFSEGLEGLSVEETLARVEEKIKNTIFDEKQTINSIKNKNLRNLGLGALAGIAAVFGPQVAKYLMHETGVSQAISSGVSNASKHFKEIYDNNFPSSPKAGKAAKAGLQEYFERKKEKIPLSQMDKVGQETLKTGKGVGDVENIKVGKLEVMTDAHGVESGGSGSADEAAEAMRNRGNAEGKMDKMVQGARVNTLTIENGSSIERTMIKSGIDPKEAHRMVSRYATTEAKALAEKNGGDWKEIKRDLMKRLNLVHPNAKIEMSPDGKNIVHFEDSPKSEWEKGAGVAEHPKTSTAQIEKQASGRMRTADIPSHSGEGVAERPDFMKSFGWTNFDERFSGIRDMRNHLQSLYVEVPEVKMVNPVQIDAEIEKLDDAINDQYKMLSERYGSKFNGIEALDGQDRNEAVSARDRYYAMEDKLNKLTDQKARLERVWDLEKEYVEKLRVLQGDMARNLYKDVPGISGPSSLKSINAREFLEQQKNGKLGEVYKYFSQILGERSIRPKTGENMFEWNKRFFRAIINSKNVNL